MTTERIDVLAVMDHWVESEVAYGADCTDLIAARATVAELIEAAKAVQEQFSPLITIHGEHTCEPMRDRLDAALARVGGVDG